MFAIRNQQCKGARNRLKMVIMQGEIKSLCAG